MSGIVLNEDNSHFFGARRAEDMTVQGCRELVDHYALGQVHQILFCPNAMRTSFASRVWQPIWDGYDPDAGHDQPFFTGTPSEAIPRARNWARERPLAFWSDLAKRAQAGALEARVNGELCSSASAPALSPIHPVARSVGGYEIPAHALHDGANLVEITGRQGHSAQILWVEIAMA